MHRLHVCPVNWLHTCKFFLHAYRASVKKQTKKNLGRGHLECFLASEINRVQNQKFCRNFLFVPLIYTTIQEDVLLIVIEINRRGGE